MSLLRSLDFSSQVVSINIPLLTELPLARQGKISRNQHLVKTKFPFLHFPGFSRWTWQMAWRDSRTSRRRLLLFSASIVLGIAALVAISSFGKSLKSALDDQAKSLPVADLP